jgi:TonB family protein
MMLKFFAASLLMLAAAFARTQSAEPAPTAPAVATPSTVTVLKHYIDLKIHYKGPGVTAPEFLPINITFGAHDHCKKLDGEEQLLIAVDRTGTPHAIKVLKSLGNDLDAMALHVVELDKFKPGAVDGAPANVAVADDMKLQACRLEKKDDQGPKQKYLELRSAPEQVFELVEPPFGAPTEIPPTPDAQPGIYKIGGGVTAPVLIHDVAPEFSEAARRANYQGICLVSVIVDVNGNPQNARIVRPLGMGLDEKALEAVRQFRFKPAMKDGKTPVPVAITIEVKFSYRHG